jgi:ATP-binding cassette, subfamily B (MDR/TAP), member 1
LNLFDLLSHEIIYKYFFDRLSTIRNADVIICLDGGFLAEMGTHEQLMKNKGIYYNLVKIQSSKEKIEDQKEDQRQDKENQRESDNLANKAKQEKIATPIDQQNVHHRIKINSNINRFSSNLKEKASELKIKRKRFRLMKKHEKLLWRFHKPDALYIIAGTLGQIAYGAIFALIALVFTQIYTLFAMEDKNEQLKRSLLYMGYMIALAIGYAFSGVLYSYAFGVAGSRLTRRVRVKMFDSIIRQEMAFHDEPENKPSILMQKLATNASFCKGLTSDKLSLLAQGLSGIGCAIVISLISEWKLALVVMTFIPINFLSGIYASKSFMSSKKKKGNSTPEEVGSALALEAIESIKTVMSLGREKYFLEKYKEFFKLKFKNTILPLVLRVFAYSVSINLLFFIQATAFGYGYHLMKSENLPISYIFRIYASLTFSSTTLGRIYAMMPDQTKARQSAKSAYKIIVRKSKIDALNDTGFVPPEDENIQTIELNNVHFAYPTRKDLDVLKDFSMKISGNSITALVGSSGNLAT